MSRVFGPGPRTLICDGRAVAPVAVADTAWTRGRGLLGTRGIEGALWLSRTRSVHMVGMTYPLDVAVVDGEGVVLFTTTLPPWRGMTRSRRRAAATVDFSKSDRSSTNQLYCSP